jgi:hypothetical protein
MASLSKRLSNVINATHKKLIKNNRILPVEVPEGILVGNILIVCDGSAKHLFKDDQLVYKDIHLNKAAIAIANLLATNTNKFKANEIYEADREHSRWFTDSQMLKTRYHQAEDARDYQLAEIFWARYVESRNKTIAARKRVNALIQIA